MQSSRDSVHRLLEDQIQQLGLQADYEVQKAGIIGQWSPRRRATAAAGTEVKSVCRQ